MGVNATTLYSVVCDYCHTFIVEPRPDLSEAVSLALGRAGHRYDYSRGAGDVWECNNCKASRELAEEAFERRRSAGLTASTPASTAE